MKKIIGTMLIIMFMLVAGMTTVYAEMEESTNINCKFFYTQLSTVADTAAHMGVNTEEFEFNIEFPYLLIRDTGVSKLSVLPLTTSETIYLVEHVSNEKVNYITLFPSTGCVVFVKQYGYSSGMFLQMSIGAFKVME